MRLPLIAAGCLLFKHSFAVFADEAWNIDYHFALLGQPKQDTTYFHQPNPNSKASLIYTLSDKGVLGAVNPRDGSVVWRQLLSYNAGSANASFLRAGEGQNVVVSGIGHEVAAWSAADGRQVWSLEVGDTLEDVEILELSGGKATGVKDAVVLSGGDHPAVQRIDGASGTVKWQYKLDGGDIPYQVSASSTEIFAILLHKTMLGYIKIRVLSLDPVDGHRMDEYSLSSDSELASASNIVSVGANSASPIIAWTDITHSTLKINLIGSKAVSSFNVKKHNGEAVEHIAVHAPHQPNSLSHFLVHFITATSHWAEVFQIDLKKGRIEKAYSLPKIDGKGAFATSTSDANVYFTRITRTEVISVSSVSHGVLGRWKIDGFGVAAGPEEIVDPISAVSELSIKGDTVSAIRTAVLLSTGDWVLLREGNPTWQRPELLAGTISATFATPSIIEGYAHELAIEAHGNPVRAYIRRIRRHLEDLQRLPAVLSSLPQRFLRAFLGTSADAGMANDIFGFHKIISCLTDNGRIVALDAGKPDRILWSRRVEQPNSGEKGELTVSASSDIIVLRTAQESNLQHINATNGESLSGRPAPNLTKSHSTSGVQYSLNDGKLSAHRPGPPRTELWHFTPMIGERVISLVPRPVNDPVASIGKVLGDRRVLYKYLDPNLALMATANDAAKTANFYILDTISGAIVYSNSHSGVVLEDPISSITSENWFAYSYTAEASDSSPKGHQLVVGEMFESLVPNDRGPLAAASNFSSAKSSTEPFTMVKTYQIPEAISKLAVTQTQQGITSRQLLAVIAGSQAIVGIPYGFLDPRRPVDRDPTKDEQAEGLMRYSPVIEFDPKWHLNHQREVLGIENIITSPALIESTSLVFAYGLDIFGTRLSPSFSFDILGQDFNKFQMLATVAALAVATFVVAPLVSLRFHGEVRVWLTCYR